MNSARQTPDHLFGIQQELIDREPIFHRPEFGTTRAAFAAMMAEEFWETGASGTPYSKEFILDTLERRHSTPHEDHWKTEDFYCQQIAADNYLLTYTLHQGSRATRRATIWRRSARGWLIVYHQGTLVQST